MTPTHPTQKIKTAKRSYKVKVQYLVSPRALYVGYRSFSVEGEVVFETVKNHSCRDRLNLHEFLGRDVTDEELMVMVEEGTRVQRDNGTSFCDLFIPMAPAKFGWAGAGGWWCEVPVATVKTA